MENLEHKSIITKPYDLTYSYYLSPNFHKKLDPSTPTLVFAHGYPDDAYMWAGAVPFFLDLPYPFIVLDLLGFGGSSKPTEPAKYNYKQQADSVAQILEHEDVPDNVIPIGHDWGSGVSQRTYLYHKKKCIGLCLLSLAYQIPSPEPFDLVEANKQTAKRFGYPQWEYWNFFVAPDAPKLMEDNILRFYDVNHGNYPSPKPEEEGRDIWMREMFCTPGAMRDYVAQTGKYAGYTVPLKEYSRGHEQLRRDFAARIKRDGMAGPVCYYKALKDNTMLEDERLLCRSADNKDKKIEVPLLYIGQTGDWVCRTDLMKDAVDEGLVSDLEERVVKAGHWVLYEKPEEIAALIIEWLKRRFPVKA